MFSKGKYMGTQLDKRYSAPAVEQACRILFGLAGSPSSQLSLTEISRQVGVSGSKAFGLLSALEKSNLIKRGRDGKGYALGPGLIPLSRKVIDDIVPSEIAKPVLDTLSKDTGCTSVFGLITGETVYVAARRENGGDIRIVMNIGYAMPLTHGAHGKAIVAFLPEAERSRILSQEDLHFYPDPGKLDRDHLTDELAQCRREGFACAISRSTPGITVVAAPVFGFSGNPIGFLEIFVLASVESARRFGPMVSRAGKALSLQLGADVSVENAS
jgi:DNA-binding IclR family transcriptional regulator